LLFLDGDAHDTAARRDRDRTAPRELVTRTFVRAVSLSLLALLIGASMAWPERLPIRAFTTTDGLAHNEI